jgi:putative ABC transport system permease protein
MGVKSLIFSIPIGIGLSYIIYKSLGVNQSIEFTIPINAIVIAIIAVFLLITVIMKYSMSKINKQNTIETIRNENI